MMECEFGEFKQKMCIDFKRGSFLIRIKNETR